VTRSYLGFLLTRARFCLPLLGGLFMVTMGPARWIGVTLLCFAAAEALTLRRRHPDIETMLELRAQKYDAGIRRQLERDERAMVLKLYAYSQRLLSLGGQEAISEDIMKQTWRILSNHPQSNARSDLKAFFDELPSLEENHRSSRDDLKQRLERELNALRAADLEIGEFDMAGNQ